MSNDNIYSLIEASEVIEAAEDLIRPRVLKPLVSGISEILSLTRSTQQHCINCGFCCPEYGLRVCVKCNKETSPKCVDKKIKLS